MDFLMIFSDLETVLVKHSELRVLKRTKHARPFGGKYGKRAKNTLLGLVLTGPRIRFGYWLEQRWLKK